MNKNINDRVYKEAYYMLNEDFTIRKIANKFNISKSTVHKDLNKRLKEMDIDLYKKVDTVLKEHIKVRHIRGGEATKDKYKKRYYEKI